MKLWRGQPEHSYWKATITSRDRAHALLAMGFVGFGMALVQYMSPGSSCAQGGRILCVLVRAIAAGSKLSIESAEVLMWAVGGVVFTALGVLQWRER